MKPKTRVPIYWSHYPLPGFVPAGDGGYVPGEEVKEEGENGEHLHSD